MLFIIMLIQVPSPSGMHKAAEIHCNIETFVRHEHNVLHNITLQTRTLSTNKNHHTMLPSYGTDQKSTKRP